MLVNLKNNRFLKNWLFLSGSNITTILIKFGIVISITKILPVSDYGFYVTVISTVNILVTIADFGTKTEIIRTVSKEESYYKNFFLKALKMRLLMILILFTGIFFI